MSRTRHAYRWGAWSRTRARARRRHSRRREARSRRTQWPAVALRRLWRGGRGRGCWRSVAPPSLYSPERREGLHEDGGSLNHGHQEEIRVDSHGGILQTLYERVQEASALAPPGLAVHQRKVQQETDDIASAEVHQVLRETGDNRRGMRCKVGVHLRGSRGHEGRDYLGDVTSLATLKKDTNSYVLSMLLPSIMENKPFTTSSSWATSSRSLCGKHAMHSAAW